MLVNNKLWLSKWSQPKFPLIAEDVENPKHGGRSNDKAWFACMCNSMGSTFKEGMTVLDYGCGNGELCNFLAQHLKDFKYYGVEPKKERGLDLIQGCKRTYDDSRVDFGYIGSEVEKIALNTCDVVLAASVFNHLLFEHFADMLENKFLKCTREHAVFVITMLLNDEYLRTNRVFAPNYTVRVYYSWRDLVDLSQRLGVKLELMDKHHALWVFRIVREP